MITDKEAAERIRKTCMHRDLETAHSDADDILCEVLKALGYKETVEAWLAVDKWYA